MKIITGNSGVKMVYFKLMQAFVGLLGAFRRYPQSFIRLTTCQRIFAGLLQLLLLLPFR